MAFTPSTLCAGHGGSRSNGDFLTYLSTDTAATVQTAGYFPVVPGVTIQEDDTIPQGVYCKEGDFIFVKASNSSFVAVIEAASSTQLVATPL